MKAAYRRILVKLSGGQLAGESGFGISPAVIAHTATEIREVHELGVQLSVVVGGGNVAMDAARTALRASAYGESTVDSWEADAAEVSHPLDAARCS